MEYFIEASPTPLNFDTQNRAIRQIFMLGYIWQRHSGGVDRGTVDSGWVPQKIAPGAL